MPAGGAPEEVHHRAHSGRRGPTPCCASPSRLAADREGETAPRAGAASARSNSELHKLESRRLLRAQDHDPTQVSIRLCIMHVIEFMFGIQHGRRSQSAVTRRASRRSWTPCSSRRGIKNAPLPARRRGQGPPLRCASCGTSAERPCGADQRARWAGSWTFRKPGRRRPQLRIHRVLPILVFRQLPISRFPPSRRPGFPSHTALG